MKAIASCKRTWLLLLLMCLPARSQDPSTDLGGYKPSWATGQTWYVEVETLTEPPEKSSREKFVPKKVVYGYAFTVEARKELEGEACYQVRIEIVARDGEKIEVSPGERKEVYRIFIRTDDCSLKMIQRLDVNNGAVEASHKYARGPVHATNWTDFLPLDFPIFSQDAQKYAPPDPSTHAEKHDRQPIRSWQKHRLSEDAWVVNGTEKPALIITLTREHPGEKSGPEIADQVWVKGVPWPLRSEYKHGRRPPLSARLVQVDGSPIASTVKAKNPQQ